MRRSRLNQLDRDLVRSLALLAVVVTLALAGLATDHNWPKLLRVAASFTAYAALHLAFLRARRRRAQDTRLAFLAAAAGAGIVSGLVRPVFSLDLLLIGTVAAGVLLGGVHYLAIKRWRSLLPRAGA